MKPMPTAIPKATMRIGPTIVNGRPHIHSDDARNDIARPWAIVVNIANQVQGSEDHFNGVVIAPNSPSKIPRDIPKMIGVRMSSA